MFKKFEFGGSGSGNFGHEGRPGERGGSGEGGGGKKSKYDKVAEDHFKGMTSIDEISQEVDNLVEQKDRIRKAIDEERAAGGGTMEEVLSKKMLDIMDKIAVGKKMMTSKAWAEKGANMEIYISPDSSIEFDAVKNLFKKEVARVGRYRDRHGNKVELTEAFFDELVKNFKPEDNVPIPFGHTGMEDPTKNTGFVAGLERVGKSLFALMNIKKEEAAKGINEGTIKGVSIGVLLSEAVGKVLGHIALTLQPAIPDLADFVACEKYDVRVFELEKEITATEAERAAEREQVIKKEQATELELKLLHLEAQIKEV